MLLEGRINVELSGAEDAPALVMHHALGACLDMWKPQLAVLEPHFRIIRMDMRGHGKSGSTDGPFSMEDLAGDVALVLDALEVDRCTYLGLSVGGMIGQGFAINHPDRLDRLVLSNTTSIMPTELRPLWDARIDAVREGGMETQVAMTLERWFTPEYAAQNPDILDWIATMVRGADPASFSACCAAIRDLDFRDRLGAIQAPTLVIAGAEDIGTPPERGQEIADAIPDARFMLIHGVSHLSNVQTADQFNGLVLPFLTEG